MSGTRLLPAVRQIFLTPWHPSLLPVSTSAYQNFFSPKAFSLPLLCAGPPPWTLVPRKLSLPGSLCPSYCANISARLDAQMSLATPHPTCLRSQDRDPFFGQPSSHSRALSPGFQALACQPFPESSLTSSVALLWPTLQPERQPMRTFPPYPEEVLRAPPDTQPASRYDPTPGPRAKCVAHTKLWLHLFLSHPIQKYLENYLNRLLTMSFYRNYHAMVRSGV